MQNGFFKIHSRQGLAEVVGAGIVLPAFSQTMPDSSEYLSNDAFPQRLIGQMFPHLPPVHVSHRDRAAFGYHRLWHPYPNPVAAHTGSFETLLRDDGDLCFQAIITRARAQCCDMTSTTAGLVHQLLAICTPSVIYKTQNNLRPESTRGQLSTFQFFPHNSWCLTRTINFHGAICPRVQCRQLNLG